MHTVTHLLQACFKVHVGRWLIAIFSTHVGIFLSWYVPFQYLLLVVSQQWPCHAHHNRGFFWLCWFVAASAVSSISFMPTKQRYFFGIVFTLGCLIIFCSSWHWWHWCSIFLCSLISFLASDGELDLLVHLSFGDHSWGSPHLRHNAALTHTDPSCSWQKICLLCVIRCLSLSALGCLLLSFFLSWVEVPPLYWCNGNRQRLVFCSYWNAICYLLLFIPSQFCLPVGVWGCDDQVAVWSCLACVQLLHRLRLLSRTSGNAVYVVIISSTFTFRLFSFVCLILPILDVVVMIAATGNGNQLS